MKKLQTAAMTLPVEPRPGMMTVSTGIAETQASDVCPEHLPNAPLILGFADCDCKRADYLSVILVGRQSYIELTLE